MVRIAPVNLLYNPKVLWFDAQDLVIAPGDPVVVTTARGMEFGHLAAEIFDATDEQVANLKSALKPVLRIASQEDKEAADKMEQLSREALPIFKQLAAETNEDMHPVSVEYLLDGDKAIFYFEAGDRVDFRDLVRKVAAQFHVRIDMRQIGVRDEARMVGGLGHCGQELCCKRLGGEFCQVTIRMAKEQDLSLNPQKISGVCGRLMCCLRYEFDAYKDFNSRAPKQNASIETPAGIAKVVSLDVPREIVTLRIEGEKPVRIPLADFEPPEEGIRPRAVGEQAWNRAQDEMSFGSIEHSALFGSTTQFKGDDQLAKPRQISEQPGKKRKANDKKNSAQKQLTGGLSGASGAGREKARRRNEEAKSKDGSLSSRKLRRRRTTTLGTEEQAKGAASTEQTSKQATSGALRPGRRSSGLRNQRAAKPQGAHAQKPQPRKRTDSQDKTRAQGSSTSSRRPQTQARQVTPKQQNQGGSAASSQKPNQQVHRRRRRSHKASGTQETQG